MKQIGIGVIGCGAISRTYLPNLKNAAAVRIVGVADLVREKAEAAAERFQTKVMTNEEIYNDPEIEIVVNLTNVWSHYEVTKAALEHGKHVYSEKMMAENFFRAKELYDIAKEKGLRLAMAPDTCLGGGYQTVRKLLDDGVIGVPFAVNAYVVRSYLQAGPKVGLNNVVVPGGTIPFDMGGYYLNAMITCFGAVKRVSGFSTYLKKKFSHPANPRYGEDFLIDDPEAPNLIQAALEFECGVLGTLTACDYGTNVFPEEGLMIYGTKGRMFCPDPNTFGGPVKLRVAGDSEWREMPLLFAYNGTEPYPGTADDKAALGWETSRRGVGVIDLAWAILNDRPQRLSNEQGLHMIEIIHGVVSGCTTGQYYEMTTHPKRMVPLRPVFIGGDAEAVFDDRYGADFDAEPKWSL